MISLSLSPSARARSLQALALGAVLAQPFEPFVLSGAVTTGQLLSNLKAAEAADFFRANPDILERLMHDCRVDSEHYWSDRAALAWN